MDSIQCYGVLLSKNTVLRDEVRFISAVLDESSLSEQGFVLFSAQENFITPNDFWVNSWNPFSLLHMLKVLHSGILPCLSFEIVPWFSTFCYFSKVKCIIVSYGVEVRRILDVVMEENFSVWPVHFL
jgi:hypothetical protein